MRKILLSILICCVAIMTACSHEPEPEPVEVAPEEYVCEFEDGDSVTITHTGDYHIVSDANDQGKFSLLQGEKVLLAGSVRQGDFQSFIDEQKVESFAWEREIDKGSDKMYEVAWEQGKDINCLVTVPLNKPAFVNVVCVETTLDKAKDLMATLDIKYSKMSSVSASRRVKQGTPNQEEQKAENEEEVIPDGQTLQIGLVSFLIPVGYTESEDSTETNKTFLDDNARSVIINYAEGDSVETHKSAHPDGKEARYSEFNGYEYKGGEGFGFVFFDNQNTYVIEAANEDDFEVIIENIRSEI